MKNTIKSLFGLALIIGASFSVRAQSSAWQTVSNNPPCTGRDETAMTALDGKLYLIGGRGIEPVEEYDPAANGWKKLAPPPMELHHFQALAVDGRILVLGAMTGGYPKETPVTNIWWFDPKNNEWTKGMEIPEGRRRGGAGAVLSDGNVYLVCGITNGHWNGFVPWMDKLNLKTGKWTVLADAPHARDHFNAVLVKGNIIAADGRTSYGEKNQVFNLLVPEVDVFDIATGQWSTLPNNLPTPRAGGMVVARDGKVIVIGGESVKQSAAHNEVEALTLATGQWETLPPLNMGCHGTGADFLGDTLYVVSGVGKRGGSPLLTAMQELRWPVLKKAN
jgi:N-acetylneuraminic acid mutarotase